MKLNQKLFLR